MKPILYYAADCPDTAPFVAELKRLGVDYESEIGRASCRERV